MQVAKTIAKSHSHNILNHNNSKLLKMKKFYESVTLLNWILVISANSSKQPYMAVKFIPDKGNCFKNLLNQRQGHKIQMKNKICSQRYNSISSIVKPFQALFLNTVCALCYFQCLIKFRVFNRCEQNSQSH